VDKDEFSVHMSCGRLPVDYCRAFDNLDVNMFMELFTSDAQYSRPPGEWLAGHAEIRGSSAEHKAEVVLRHVATNVLITPMGSGRARGQSL
jgi:hypothetical protein